MSSKHIVRTFFTFEFKNASPNSRKPLRSAGMLCRADVCSTTIKKTTHNIHNGNVKKPTWRSGGKHSIMMLSKVAAYMNAPWSCFLPTSCQASEKTMVYDSPFALYFMINSSQKSIRALFIHYPWKVRDGGLMT